MIEFTTLTETVIPKETILVPASPGKHDAAAHWIITDLTDRGAAVIEWDALIDYQIPAPGPHPALMIRLAILTETVISATPFYHPRNGFSFTKSELENTPEAIQKQLTNAIRTSLT